MSKRVGNLVLATTSLVLGGLLYVLFRPATIVAHFFGQFPIVYRIQTFLEECNCSIASYIMDYLWGLSLSCGLMAIHNPTKKGTIWLALLAFGWGCFWEILQWLRIVSGTGDLLDICIYSLAAMTSIFINIKERKP